MKLKNPSLETSFSFTTGSMEYFVYQLEINCRFDNEDGKVYYFIQASADSFSSVSLGMGFLTAEDAFAMADRICSEYPFLGYSLSLPEEVDLFPEFDREKFIK